MYDDSFPTQLSLAVQESEEKWRRESAREIDIKGKQRAV